MLLRGVEFGHVFNASGARGFHGEGYWFHKLWKPLGLNYDGATFVAKTTTLEPRKGNMLLDVDSRPFDLFPDCIVVKPLDAVVLNAVGLSGPGMFPLVDRWKKRQEPGQLILSVMSIAATPEERLQESKTMFELLRYVVDAHGTDRVGLQINLSCPNVGLDTSHLFDEAARVLDYSRELGIGTMVKLSAIIPLGVAKLLASHDGCDALVMSNTIPWGQCADRINWRGLFGPRGDKPFVSPLAKYGGGGLSGAPLLPIVARWIRGARLVGITKPIVGGGGVLAKEDADILIDSGASAIELGSVSILRPWRVRGIIHHVNARLDSKDGPNGT
jgi:dihydroorotate dehydrogenase